MRSPFGGNEGFNANREMLDTSASLASHHFRPNLHCMTSSEIKEKWLSFIRGMNERGVPLPMARADGKASLTATFAWVSFNIWIVSVIGKASGALGGMDSGDCLQMFVACSCLHLGRKMQRDNTGAISVGDNERPNRSESKAPEAKSDPIIPG